MAALAFIILTISTPHAQIVEKDFSLSSEFSHMGPFDKISLSRIFLGNRLSLSVEFYGAPRIQFHRNARLMINGYPYYAGQESATSLFGGSLGVYDINGPKADGDILSGALSNAVKVELEIPLENLQMLTWTLPEKVLTEWKKLLAEKTPVHTLSRDEVSQLYVTILGRASEGTGNAYWCATQSDMASAADAMLALDAVKEYFGQDFYDNRRFIKLIYEQTLGKEPYQDPGGIAYWTAQLHRGKSRGQVIADLIHVLTGPANRGSPSQKRFNNKVDVSNYVAENISRISEIMNISALKNLISNVDNNLYSVYLAKNSVDEYVDLSGENNDEEDDGIQEEQQPPAPSNLKIEKKESTHVLTWDIPAEGNIASIEVWVAEDSQRRDAARLAVTIAVDKEDMGTQGQYIHSGFDPAKKHTYWIRSISPKRYHSDWCPWDGQGGYVVPAGENTDADTGSATETDNG